MHTTSSSLSLTRNMFKVAIKFQSNLISHTFFLLNFTLSSEERKRDVEWLRKQTKKYLCNTFLISSRLIYLSLHRMYTYWCVISCYLHNDALIVIAFVICWGILYNMRERESLRRFFRSQEVIKWRFFSKLIIFVRNCIFFCNLKK